MIKKFVLLPSIGYIIVAFVCGLAGHAIIPERSGMNSGEVTLLVILMLLLFPIYINRAILYEQKKHNPFDGSKQLDENMIKVLSTGLPILIFSIVGIFILSIFLGAKLNLPVENITWYSLIGRYGIAIAPSYLFGLWNAYGWKKDNRVYLFRYRSFFPALANGPPRSKNFGTSKSDELKGVFPLISVPSAINSGSAKPNIIPTTDHTL